MKELLIFALNVIWFNANSQATYSKLIDLDIAINNTLTDLEVSNEFVFVSSLHLCPSDTSNNILYQCTGISKYDMTSNLLDKTLLDTFFPEGSNRLLLDKGKLFLSGHFREDFNGRSTILLEFNDSLRVESTHDFPSSIGTVPNNDGVINFNNAFYLYGKKLNTGENKYYSHIIKVNEESKQIDWDIVQAHALQENECFDLQKTIEDNLVFIQHFSDGSGSQGESGFQIVKIDTLGNLLDSFDFEDIHIDHPRLLASREGPIYFTSQDPPYPHTIPSNGRINKIDSGLDVLEWSLQLPANPFVDGHRFKVYDYLQTFEGDIVACGTVWEEGPDGPLGTPNNHTWNGFIVRVTQSGEIVWLKIYRHPNTSPQLPINEFGEFRPSLLSKIYETPDNNFIAGGTVYYNAEQEGALPNEENKSSIWLMNVDKNGCLKGEECIETIILNGVNDIAPKFNIGTTWVYEVIVYPLPIVTTFQTYTITDTTIINAKTVFVIENDFDNSIEYMLVEGEQVYFWDSFSSTFRLNFDFSEVTHYESPWTGVCTQDSGISIISIDSISSIVVNDDSIHVQNVAIGNNGTTTDDIKTSIYKNIGLKELGLKIPLGMALCDFDRAIEKLRCFENDSMSYNFVDYPCDSIWFSTGNHELEYEKRLIYPNPSSGLFYFDGIELDFQYQLFDSTGKLIQKGIILERKLRLNDKGLYFLRYYSNYKWVTVKLIVI